MPDIDPEVFASLLAAQEHMITALQEFGIQAKRAATALEQIADHVRPIQDIRIGDELVPDEPVRLLVDADPQKRPSWTCETCGQKNDGWATECGRCETWRTLDGRRVEFVTEKER